MFSRVAVLGMLIILSCGCVNHPASDSVKLFAMALADSSWSDAWNQLTPGTRAAWDSTAVVMQRFGYTESTPFLTALETPLTEEEFGQMTGELLFTRMVESAPDIRQLSSSVRSVELVDSVTALVTVATVDGSQIIPVKLIGQRWLIDLTSLTPPPVVNETD
jgi:hypothetical protein